MAWSTIVSKHDGFCGRCITPFAAGTTIRYGGRGMTYHTAKDCEVEMRDANGVVHTDDYKLNDTKWLKATNEVLAGAELDKRREARQAFNVARNPKAAAKKSTKSTKAADQPTDLAGLLKQALSGLSPEQQAEQVKSLRDALGVK